MKIIKSLLALAVLAPMQMKAQQPDATILADEYEIGVIPGTFTLDNQSKIHDSVDRYYFSEDVSSCEIKVYNDNFDAIATFNYTPAKYASYQWYHRDLSWSIDAPLVLMEENFLYIPWVGLRFLNMQTGTISTCNNTFFTQTLFNNDEQFEYIVPKYRLEEKREESIPDVTGPVEDLIIYNYVRTTGIEVKSQNGNTIFSLDFDTELDGQLDPITVISWADKTYLCFGDSKSSSKLDVYLLNRENSSIDLVKTNELNAMRLFPSIARKDSMVTVDLGGKTNENSGTIFVTDMNGRTVYTKNVALGENTTQIPLNRLASGMYIVSLMTDGNSHEAAKLIVK